MTLKVYSPIVIIQYKIAKGKFSLINPVSVGEIIRELRKKKGLTQEQLSGLATLDRTHYSKIERGLRSPTIDTIFKISFALDIKPHELIKIIEEKIDFDFQ